ncbi:hypothetical protein A2U01_0039483, partial [Trifolium medium]|nr:hypothetical protein [Trifolium medium]
MAPKRTRTNTSSGENYIFFLDDAKEDHYETIKHKGIVQEMGIDFSGIPTYPRMRQITEG